MQRQMQRQMQRPVQRQIEQEDVSDPDYEYESNNDDGNENVNLMETSEEEDSDIDEDGEEVLDAGVVDTDSDNESIVMDLKPTPKPKPKKKTQSKLQSNLGTSPVPVRPKPKSDVVDVGNFTMGKIYKASLALKNQHVGHVLPQPITATDPGCRVETKPRGKSVPQQLSELVASGKVTRDTCVKVVCIKPKNEKAAVTGPEDVTFEYFFGVWTMDGRVCPFTAEQMKSLIKADFASKNMDKPHQTPNKWIIDKENMVDPDSFHIINFKGTPINVPMPITSSCSYASYVLDRTRAKKKQNKNKKQAKLNMFTSASASPKVTKSASASPKITKSALASPKLTRPALASPKRKADAIEEPVAKKTKTQPTPNPTPPTTKELSFKEWVQKHVKSDGNPIDVAMHDTSNGGEKMLLCTISAKEILKF